MSSQRETTSVTKPYEELLPYYRDLWGGARTGPFANPAPQLAPMQGTRYAEANPQLKAGNAALYNASNQMGGGAQIRNLAQDTAGGKYLGVTPQLKGALNAAAAPITRAYSETLLPQITDQAIASGAYGGARQDLSQEQALRNYATEASDATNRIAFQNYGAERGIQTEAGSLFNQANALYTAPAQAKLQAGQNALDWSQISKNNAFFNYQNNNDTTLKNEDLKWAPFKNFADLLGSGGFGETKKVEPLSILTQIMQALGGLGGLVGAFGGLPLGMGQSKTT